MTRRHSQRAILPAALILAAGQPVSARALPEPPAPHAADPAPQAPAPDREAAGAPATGAESPPAAVDRPDGAPSGQPAADQPIRFSFKDAPYDQVMDFMARQTGLPVIREADLPNAPVTFISATDYSLSEAIDVLNRMLFMHGLQLRREENFLLLTKIENMRALGPKFHDQVPAGVAAAQVVTVVVPLHNASAQALAEQLKPLVGPYGALTALPQQNALILVDTAAQCRRLRAVIDDLDAERPSDAQVKMFPLRRGKAEAVLAALKGLVAEKRTTFFIDKDGKKTQVQDDTTPGLNLQADPRTNSILAVGPASRLATVEELVALLDKAEGADDQREIMTFAMAGTTPQQAAATLTTLFAKGPAEERPTLLPLPTQSKLTVVGTPAQLAQAAAVLGELDPEAQPTAAGGKPPATPETRAAVIRLAHVTPAAAMGVLETLLSPRVRSVVRFAAAPDAKGLVASGPAADVEQFQAIVAGIDQPPDPEREVRQLRLVADDPAGLLARAMDLYRETSAGRRSPVSATLDAAARTVTAVGPREGLAAFADVLRTVEAGARIDREKRLVEVRHAKASDVARTLTDLSRSSRLFAAGGEPEPVLEPVEATNSLMVAAAPGQMAILEGLIRALDNQQVGERPPLRILRIRTTDAASLAQVLNQAYQQRPPEQRVRQPVEIQADPATNTLLVSAHADLFPEIEKIVGELNETRADKDGREIRIFPLKVAAAEELARTIDQMYPQPPVPLDPRTRQPRPDLQPPREIVVRADRMTNSLIVDAPASRLAGFEQLVRALDQQKLPDDVELRTYRVERAALDAVAATLRSLAAGNGLTRGVPIGAGGASAAVTISTEPMSRTLIVSGPSEIFAEVEKVLARLDAAPERPPTGLKMYALKHARAERLQPLFTRLLTARLREQQARDGAAGGAAVDPAALLDVAADPATNSLIISAPEGVQQVAGELVSALDTTAAETARSVVRVVPLVHADPQQAAAALNAAAQTMDLPSGGRVTILATAGSRSLVISGVEGDLAKVEELARSLDARPSTEGAIDVRTIPLRHARAESVAPMVEQLLSRPSLVDQLPPWQKLEYLRSQKADAAPVRAVAERRMNAVVVTGPASIIEVAEQVVRDLDVDATAGDGGRAVRVIPLQNADAQAVAANVTAVFVDDDAASPGEVRPTVRVDQASNILIVRGSDRQLAAIEQLVESIDQATLNTSREMRLVPVDRSRADAALMAQTLRRLLEQRGGVKVEVISAEDLLKAAPSADEGKDRPSGGGPRGDAGPPAHGWMAEVLAMAVGTVDEKDRAGSPGVTIAVDPATNSLIVLGSPRMAQRVAALAAELERQMPTEPGKIRIVTLPESADARAIAQVVSATAAQVGRAGPGNPGGFSGRVAVDADPGGGALIVSANDTDFAVLSELIAAIARPAPSASLTVKVYPLANVTAQRAARAIGDLLSADPRSVQARRVRSLDITVDAPGAPGAGGRGTIDPASVRVTPDPGGGSLIVAAPKESMPILDRFIALIDQSPVSERFAIRRFVLRNAKADAAARTMQAAFDAARQGPSAQESPRAAFLADERTNSLLVTGTEAHLRETERLLGALDAPLGDDGTTVAIIPLQVARPASVRQALEAVLVGHDPARRDRLQIVAQDDSNLLILRALPEQVDRARAVVAEMDRAETSAFPVRSLRLERADAEQVARSLQQFFDDRARATGRAGPRAQRRIAIVGDRRSGSLIVSASDEEYAQVQSLVREFDAATARDLAISVIPLQNARASEVRQTVESIAWQIAFQDRAGPGRETLLVEVDERSNSVIVMGGGESAQTIERLVRTLDSPRASGGALAVRAVRVRNADPRTVAAAIQSATATPNWPRWRGADPDAVRADVDQRSRMVVLVGRADRLDQAAQYAEQLDSAAGVGGGDQAIETIGLRFARADQVAASLSRFFQDRARAQGAAESRVSLIGSRDGNVLVVGAPPEDMALVRQMLTQMDQPDEGEGRRREIFPLRNADARELASMLQEQFPRSLSSREGLVIVTAQPSTNSVIVSAPEPLLERVQALVAQLDAPPSAESARIVTVTLSAARAEDVADSLKKALPASVKVVVTPVRRTNSLLLTGSDEAIGLVMEQINRLDAQPARSPAEFRRVKLAHADAYELAATLRNVLPKPAGPADPAPVVSFSSRDNTLLISATADQQAELARIIADLDIPVGQTRTMEFVPLKFADAKATATALEVFFGRNAPEAASPAARNVTIIANPLSKSLVISAEQSEWPAIRSLLEKLDNEAYDTSRRLEIVALRHADAVSLAATLTEAFAAPIRAELERTRSALRNLPPNLGLLPRLDDGRPSVPAVLVPPEEAVSVVAERLTNSIIVSAVPPLVERIKAVALQLDVPEYSRLPEARIIPLRIGPASQVAQTLRQMFTDRAPGAPGGAVVGSRAVVIAGDDRSSTLIVRADEAQFAQIKALAETIQQEGDRSRAVVRVLRLGNIPAGRVLLTVRNTFSPVAQQAGETLSLEVDRSANALVIASSERIFEQIRRVVEELDALPAVKGGAEGVGAVPGLGQSIFIIDVENNSPEQVRRQLEDMGLTRPQPQDRPGVVSEPVTIVPLASRRALAVVATPADGQAVATLVRSLDAAPIFAEQEVRIVRLRTAQAQSVAAALDGLLRSRPQDAASSPASSLVEQVRRLSVQRDGLDQPPLALDLAKPIKVLPEPQTNSVVLTSTRDNVAALAEVVRLLDRLPVGEAVIVRFFPLSNASAQRIAGILRELFSQGDRLRQTPATQIRGEPATEAGKALASQVAVSIDDRTNALIVAGREEAVALVEVLVRQLDSDKAAGWIEPVIVPLRHADAARLARDLKAILVDGIKESPEASALQRQVARIRVAQQAQPGADGAPMAPPGITETDIFAPLSSLVIVPEEQVNALIVLGSSANVRAVADLARMLDVPAAAAENSVRIYPLRFAAADRVAAMVKDVFRQQVAAGAIRAADDVVAVADPRTNAMVVSTSPRSFTVLEKLVQQLDGQPMSPTVTLRVIPVGDGNTAELAPKIERLMRERIDSATRAGAVRSPSDTFSVQADPATRSLIVVASDENVQIVQDLVKVLTASGQAMAASETIDLVQVGAGRAADLLPAVRELYVDKQNARRGADAVRVTPDVRLNALVVRGTAEDVAAVRELVGRLEAAPVAAVTEIKRIELKRADAVEAVRLVQNVLAGRPLAGGGAVGARQALLLRFLRDRQASDLSGRTGHEPTEAEISGAIQEQVTITPEQRTNSVVVVAPTKMMVLIEQLIADLDTTAAGARTIEIFRLKNADARAMAEILRDLFNLRQQGNTLVLMPGRQRHEQPQEPAGLGPPAVEPAGVLGADLYPTSDERQQLAITIDARTNSLLVSATAEYLDQVRTVVERLDQVEANERDQLVYSLRNTKALDVARTMREYFKSEADTLRQTLGPDRAGSILRLLEREVTVQGDEKSNRVIVGVSPRYKESIDAIIRELDSTPPQVMIQVLLAEVTLDSTNTWGMDIRVGPFGGDNYNLTSLAAAGVATALGVPNLAVSSSDFQLLIRALEEQGRLEVLSRPQILVKNNEAAKIQVGEQISVPDSQQILSSGNQVTSVSRQDVGIILEVTPSISTDGFVSMSVKPEISALSSKTTQISEDFSAPVIDTRRVQTNVSVRDGETIVIGGLIQTRDDERTTKVPIIGDIPVVGLPFRSNRYQRTKTELLVILTPRVIRSGTAGARDAVRRMTEEEIGRLSNGDRILESMPLSDPGAADAADGDAEHEPALPPVPVSPPPDAAPTDPQARLPRPRAGSAQPSARGAGLP